MFWNQNDNRGKTLLNSNSKKRFSKNFKLQICLCYEKTYRSNDPSFEYCGYSLVTEDESLGEDIIKEEGFRVFFKCIK